MIELIRSSDGILVSETQSNWCQYKIGQEDTIVKSRSKSWNPFKATINYDFEMVNLAKTRDIGPQFQSFPAPHPVSLE